VSQSAPEGVETFHLMPTILAGPKLFGQRVSLSLAISKADLAAYASWLQDQGFPFP